MTRDDLARIIAAAIWRPQPCMSGNVWEILQPHHKRHAEDAAAALLAALTAPTDALVERVGRAICDAEMEDYMEDWERYDRMAKAALVAVADAPEPGR